MVIPAWGKTLPTIVSCLDTTLRRSVVPTYALTDNKKTVSVVHLSVTATVTLRDSWRNCARLFGGTERASRRLSVLVANWTA